MNTQNDADIQKGIAERRKTKTNEIGERDQTLTFGRAWTHDGVLYAEGDKATLTKDEVANLKTMGAHKADPAAKADKADKATPIDPSALTDVTQQ